MSANEKIERLISASGPYWAGEGEVVRTYWTSPVRTVETDLLWLSRQSFKEFWGAGPNKHDREGVFVGAIKFLHTNVAEVDVTWDRHDVLDAIEGLKSEFSHYCLFADVYDAMRPAGTPHLHPEGLESWPGEDALHAVRRGHQEKNAELGARACKITEGGYCALFREGKALKGKGGIDDKIADACAAVYEDEFEHMLHGITDLGILSLSDADFALLSEFVVEQLQYRIRMRNAQFSFPVSEERIEAIFNGDIQPERFDYERAGLAA